MFDLNAYRERCSELRLSEEKLQEVITMTEQNQNKKIHRPLRVGLIAAALCALTVISVSAANSEALHDFILGIQTSIFVTGESEEGSFASIAMPEVDLREEEGRTLLSVDGEEIDVTDELAQDGSYTYRKDLEDSSYEIVVDAEGGITMMGYDAEGTELFHFELPAEAGDEPVYSVTDGDGQTISAPKEGVVSSTYVDENGQVVTVPEG